MKRSKPTSSASSSHGLSSEDLTVLLTRHDLRKKSLYVQVAVDPRAVAGTSKLANELYDYCDGKPASLFKGKGKAKATKKAKDSAETDVEKELLRKIQLRIWACDTVLEQIHQTLGYKFIFKGWQNTEHGLVYRYRCAQEDKENPCCSGSLRILFPPPSQAAEQTPVPAVAPSSSMLGGSSVPSSAFKKKVGRPRKDTSATPSRSLTPAVPATSSSTFPSTAKIRITHLGKHKSSYTKGEKNLDTEVAVSASKKRTRDKVLENALEAKRLDYLDEAKLLLRALQQEFEEVKEADGEALHSFVQRVKRAREESDGEME